MASNAFAGMWKWIGLFFVLGLVLVIGFVLLMGIVAQQPGAGAVPNPTAPTPREADRPY
jgi:hypothetical protein